MTDSLRAAAAALCTAIALLPAAAQGPGRGEPDCPNILTDGLNCHTALTDAPATFSNATPGAIRIAEIFTPTTNNPTRICWVGRYTGRANPAAPDESFVVRLLPDDFGLPGAAPLFERTFRRSGTAGIDRLEMACLNGNCPGNPDPAAGGHWLYSIEIAGGLPVVANGCYHLEIACLGSAELGQQWAWCASDSGNDLLSFWAQDGAYTVSQFTPRDRALCVSGGVSPFFGSCGFFFHFFPFCYEDWPNGQGLDLFTPFALSASSPGSMAMGDFVPVQRAENFQVQAVTTVSSVCFEGSWSGLAPGQPFPADWDIIYYADDAALPGGAAPIAAFRLGQTPGVTSESLDGSEVRISHPPLTFEPGRCYWLSIGRVQGLGESEPRWSWSLTRAGDGIFADRNLGAPPGAWTRSILQHQGPEVDMARIVSNFVYLFNTGPLVPLSCNDCNANGVPDADEILAVPARDCYSAAAPPGAIGGPDGRLDSCQCAVNWNRDGAVNSSDISAFLTSWLASVQAGDTGADLDCSGMTNSNDISRFLTDWLAAVADPAPTDCP